jgi:hypothetical protein
VAAVALFVRMTHDPANTPPRVAVDTVQVAAPPATVWEHIIEIDSVVPAERRTVLRTRVGFPAMNAAVLDHPREGGIRKVRYANNVAFVERAVVWDDPEFLAVAIRPDSTRVLRGRPVPLPKAGLHAFDLSAATWELAPLNEGTTRVVLTTTYRAMTWLRVANGWWSRRVMRNMQDELLAVV